VAVVLAPSELGILRSWPSQSFLLLSGLRCIRISFSQSLLNEKPKNRKQRRAEQRRHNAMPTEPIKSSEKDGNQIQGTESNKAAYASQHHKEPSWTSRSAEWARLNHGPVIAAFTIILAVIAVIQAGIYTKQLDLGKTDERAWLQGDSEFAKDGLVENAPLYGVITLRNSGKTPATDISVLAVLRIAQNSDRVVISNGPGTRGTVGAIFPNEVPPPAAMEVHTSLMDGSGKVAPYKLTPEDISSLKRGDSFALLWFQITYKDIFSKKHWTRQCSFKGFDGGGGKFNARQCTDFNGAGDDDPPDEPPNPQ